MASLKKNSLYVSSTVGLYIERFLRFYDVSLGRNAEKFSTESFQTKIKSVAPQALFTHCYAHVLNRF
jgi:hypothetical protein